jgi:acetyltransferase-like isoleucine patch superfamily enzyme
VRLGRRSYVGGGGDVTANVTVGNFTSIAANVAMHARIQHPCIVHPDFVASGPGWLDPDYPPSGVEDRIDIGSDVWIGRNVVLLGGITIGHGAIIGAYSVVARDVHPYEVVIGNPVRTLRYRFGPDTITALLRIAWWDWPDAVIAERAADFRDVRALVAKHGYETFDA